MKLMKQKLLLLLTALLSAASMWAAVNDEFTVNGLNYRVTSESPRTVAVMGYSVKPTGNLEIPSFVTYEDNDYSVTLIESYAFSDCSGLTSVGIGDNVTTINRRAFSGCSGITVVNIGSGVTAIGSDAFYGCSSVTDVFCWANPTALTWNEDGCDDFIKSPSHTTRCHVADATAWSGFTNVNVTFVTAKTSGDDADTFIAGGLEYQLSKNNLGISVRVYQYDTPRPKGDYEIPSSVAGFSVRGIGQDAFSGCTGLTTVTIPKSVRTIEKNAFAGCSNVTDVFCWADLNSLTWEGGYSEFKPNRATRCHVLDGWVEDYWQKLYTANVTFENNLYPVGTEFWDGNFKYRVTSLTAMAAELIGREESPKGDLVIPATANGYAVTSIGESAFSGCLMSSVTIPDGVTSIGDYAFVNCPFLTSVNIPEGVTSIGGNAFSACYRLTSLTLPGSVTSIGGNAFELCFNLCSITIPEGMKSIGMSAFRHCSPTDVYCYADPAELTWTTYSSDEFKKDKATKCHVRADRLAAFNAKWNTGNEDTDINATFVGDLDSPVMTDATAYNRQYDETVTAVTYQKTLGADRVGKHQAWMVPFDYTIKAADLAKFSFYRINMIANSPAPGTEASDDVWVFLTKMDEGDVLHANMPYVYKPLTAVTDYPFTSESVLLTPPTSESILECSTATDTYTFYPTYHLTAAIIDEDYGTVFAPFYYVNINGNISYTDDSEVIVGSFRWIIRKESKSGSTPSYAREMHFVDGEEGTETGIQTPSDSPSMGSAWYDLQGRKLDSKPTQKGMYLVNGKKVMVK